VPKASEKLLKNNGKIEFRFYFLSAAVRNSTSLDELILKLRRCYVPGPELVQASILW